MADQQLTVDLDVMARATDRLLADVDRLDDADLRGPSLLPGWTRAHVLTHLARNADGFVNLVTWARTGVETPMYPGGRAGRAADIEAGAGRHIGDVRLDLADSADRLLAAFADLPDEALDRTLALSSGTPLAGREVAGVRTRELEIHHVDLDCGYLPGSWPADFVATTLDQLGALFLEERDTPVRELVATDTGGRWTVGRTGPALHGPAPALLAWLTGRAGAAEEAGAAGLALDGGGPVPPAPTWT